jgi:Putative Ig domain
MKTSMSTFAWIAAVCLLAQPLTTGLVAQQAKPQNPTSQLPPQSGGLSISTDTALPKTYPRALYRVDLETRGDSVPPLHWKVVEGTLPPGLALEDNGLLHGEPTRAGEYHFAVTVTDSGKPQQVVKKGFVIAVDDAIKLVWKTPAHVSGSRIEGSVEVSNTTAEDVDLTFVVLAVAENGRATAIGYQHFVLAHAMVGQVIPFGETLPHGDYVVHVDVVGEVEQRYAIYRQRLQTPAALQVLVGP